MGAKREPEKPDGQRVTQVLRAATLPGIAGAVHALPVERLLWGGSLTYEGLALTQSFAADGTPKVG